MAVSSTECSRCGPGVECQCRGTRKRALPKWPRSAYCCLVPDCGYLPAGGPADRPDVPGAWHDARVAVAGACAEREQAACRQRGPAERGLADMTEDFRDRFERQLVNTIKRTGRSSMKAKQLMEHLQGEENAEVLIHDASTGDDLPIGRVEMKYGEPIVLHVENDGSEL